MRDVGRMTGDPVGLHRVLEPAGVLPQAAQRLDTDPVLRDDEVRVRVERLNLDAASFRQLRGQARRRRRRRTPRGAGDRRARRGKMHNPVTGSGGMLVGTVEEVGEGSPLGLAVGDRVATLVSLTLTPLVIEDDLAGWDGRSEQVPADGYADPLRPQHRRAAARRPARAAGAGGDGRLRRPGADRAPRRAATPTPIVAVIGGAGKSGSLCLAAARRAGAARTIAVVPHQAEADLLAAEPGLADEVVVCDARDPVALRDAVARGRRTGRPDHRLRRRARLRGRRDPGHRRRAAP